MSVKLHPTISLSIKAEFAKNTFTFKHALRQRKAAAHL